MRMTWCDVTGRALNVCNGNNSGTASWLFVGSVAVGYRPNIGENS